MNYKLLSILVMTALVVASNLLVEVPINSWMTWGAVIYPVTYLVTEVMNRLYGPFIARQIVHFGFIAAFFTSFAVATPRIAFASGFAFFLSQHLDISIFSRLRQQTWWVAPIAASLLATTLDTTLFFSLAFAGTDFPWTTVAVGDFMIKASIDILMLVPFRAFFWKRLALLPEGAS